MVGCTAASHDMATVVKSHSWMHIATNKPCLAHEPRITLENLVQSVFMADKKLHKWCCASFFKQLWHFLCFVVFTVLLTHLRSRYRANSHLNVAIHRSYLVALGAALHLWQQLFTVYCTQSSPRDSSLFRKLIIMFWLGFAATKQTDTHVNQWGYVSGSSTTTRLGYKVL